MISSQKSLIRFWMGMGSPAAAFSSPYHANCDADRSARGATQAHDLLLEMEPFLEERGQDTRRECGLAPAALASDRDLLLRHWSISLVTS